ncbi:MAG: hypothetical protein JWM34_3476 [Ilumatobacteraceae bacterium]|nr:hypothetical protein [Ilumatobacteraceae bacterium]
MQPIIDVQGIDQLTQADQDALFTTLINLFNGFQSRDADQLRSVYSADADWINAFGTARHGADAIVEYLRGLFADGNFDAGELVGPPATTVRRLSDDVVAVSSQLQISGQLLVDGTAIPMRDNHSLRVVVRQPNGEWRIESEMYMDARTDQTYASH